MLRPFFMGVNATNVLTLSLLVQRPPRSSEHVNKRLSFEGHPPSHMREDLQQLMVLWHTTDRPPRSCLWRLCCNITMRSVSDPEPQHVASPTEDKSGMCPSCSRRNVKAGGGLCCRGRLRDWIYLLKERSGASSGSWWDLQWLIMGLQRLVVGLPAVHSRASSSW